MTMMSVVVVVFVDLMMMMMIKKKIEDVMIVTMIVTSTSTNNNGAYTAYMSRLTCWLGKLSSQHRSLSKLSAISAAVTSIPESDCKSEYLVTLAVLLLILKAEL